MRPAQLNGTLATATNRWYGHSTARNSLASRLKNFTSPSLTPSVPARSFDPDQFAPGKTAPGRTTLSRAWRDRFPGQFKTFIQMSAERIIGVAYKVGNPLGMRALEPDNPLYVQFILVFAGHV
jgi:hypothetical protein